MTQPSLWLTAFLTASLALSRLALIGRSNWWPCGDEAYNAFHLPFWLQHCQWMPFVDVSQVPSPFVYAAFFLFKWTHDPLVGVQLVPTFISVLTVLFATLAARAYFSKSNAFLVFFLFTFSYWPLMLSWLFLQGVTTPLWECLVLWLLARAYQVENPRARPLWCLLLGATLGAAPFTFFSWPVLFLWGTGAVIWMIRSKPFPFQVPWLGLGFLLTFAPFLSGILSESYGGYFLGVGGKGQNFSLLERWNIVSDYLASIGCDGMKGTWTPQGGGYLNPLLMGFFLLGLLSLLRTKRTVFFWAYASAFVLFLLPGILSRDFEGHRILFFLPVALWTAALGCQRLLRSLPSDRRLWVLAFLLVLSVVYDAARLQSPLSDAFHPRQTPIEGKTAYDFLHPLAEQQGPGLIFSEFIPRTVDYSLSCFSYPFNAAFNPSLAPEKARWAAIFTMDIFQNDLQRTFPRMRWVALPGQERHILGVIPLTLGDQKNFLRWLAFEKFWMNLKIQLVDNPSGHSRDFLMQQMLDEYPAVPSDPFLQSCFFEELFYLYSAERTFNPEDVRYDFALLRPALENSYRRGYSNPSVTWQYARLLVLEHQDKEAKDLLKSLKVNAHPRP